MIEKLWPVIQASRQVTALNENQSRIACPSLTEEALTISASYLHNPRCIVVVKENAYQAQLLYQRLTPYLKHKCALFSVEESLRVLSIASSKEPSALRIESLHECLNDSQKVIVTHAGAMIWPLMNPKKFMERTFKLKVGDVLSLNELKNQCLKSGYTQVHRVDQPLCFAMRGGILDIFSINALYPLRIEFFDDEIDSIRYFDISSQRTIQTLNETEIIAASEVLFDEDEVSIIRNVCKEELSKRKDKLMPHEFDMLSDAIFMDLDYMEHHIPEARLVSYFSFLDEGWSILDYLKNPQVIISNPVRCNEHLSHMKDETISYIQEMVQENKMLPKYSIFHDIHEILKPYSVVENEGLLSEAQKDIRPVSLPAQPLPLTMKTLWNQAQENTVILCLKEAEIRLVTEECLRQEIPYQIAETSDLTQHGLYISTEELEEGFELIPEQIL
ncbi:MAG: transcription-repair coupling factor, partial [Erysipelotrichaceae bacterium]|nr:transcription-repair coupling factor [Erysipelotrichaceae bacterium]